MAFFDPDELVSSHRRIDAADLEALATTEFQAPRGISSVVGSIVLDESVGSQIFTAWLLESAIRKEIELIPDPEDKKRATLRRGEAAAPPEVEAILATLFGGRDEVELGTYDKPVGKAAAELSSSLTDWMPTSGFWNPKGTHRRNKAILFGVLALIGGLVVLALGGFMAARDANALWVSLVIVGAASAGAAMAALVRSWELKVRTPLGSATWLQVESFRRFLHHSESRHVEIAAGYGMLRQYTAWAVALGETERLDQGHRCRHPRQPRPRQQLRGRPGLCLVGVVGFLVGVEHLHRSQQQWRGRRWWFRRRRWWWRGRLVVKLSMQPPEPMSNGCRC